VELAYQPLRVSAKGSEPFDQITTVYRLVVIELRPVFHGAMQQRLLHRYAP